MLPATIAVAQDSEGIETEFLFDIQLELPDSSHWVGDTPYGGRNVFPIIGGTVEGPMIKGEVLHGADYGLGRADESFELDVRLVFRTDDDALINMYYIGLIFETEDGDQYWRIVARFETGAEQYDWLNRVIAVGTVMEPIPSYKLYAVK